MEQFEIQTNPVYNYSEEVLYWLKTGSGMTFLLFNISEDILLKPKSQKWVMRLVRHYDQDERETDGAVHWNSMGPKTAESISEGWRAKILGL